MTDLIEEIKQFFKSKSRGELIILALLAIGIVCWYNYKHSAGIP